MMENNTQFLFACSSNRYFIKIIGTPRYTNCADFSFFVANIASENTFEDILVDLSQTEFLDSTSLGLLAKLAGNVVTKFERKMTVISTNKEINDLLINTGFDQIMLIVDEPSKFSDTLEALPNINNVDKNMAKMMLDAHRELSNMNDKNETEFKAVVEMLSNEVESDLSK